MNKQLNVTFLLKDGTKMGIETSSFSIDNKGDFSLQTNGSRTTVLRENVILYSEEFIVKKEQFLQKAPEGELKEEEGSTDGKIVDLPKRDS